MNIFSITKQIAFLLFEITYKQLSNSPVRSNYRKNAIICVILYNQYPKRLIPGIFRISEKLKNNYNI